jgi:uncharacterized membrane protein
MTTATETQPPAAPAERPDTPYPKPHTDAAAIREICHDLLHMHDRAQEIKADPAAFRPRLVLSEHVRGNSILDKIADGVNRICGSMWVFIGITVGIICWLFLGNVIGFDKTPWPLLLTILNLPQLSIMVSLQVSANRAQAASDKRAIADHETLIALHEMAKQQLSILEGQQTVLTMLQHFGERDMPGKQDQLQATADQILAAVTGQAGQPARA